MNTSESRSPKQHPPAMMRRSTRLIAAMAAAVMGISMVGLTALPASADSKPVDPASPASPVTASPDVLPTVQIDGVVWQQTVIGNTVYAVGQFSTARPAGAAPGVNTTPRSNILAFDIRTGALITSFNASLNGMAKTVSASPDGKRVYVGGAFTQVNGVDRRFVAALDSTTGALITSFAPLVNSRVYAIQATDNAVYMGGWFTAVGSAKRDKLAAVAPSNAALLPFNPVVGGGNVSSLVVSPDRSKVVAGGNFTSVNGSTNPGTGWAAINTSTSALEPWLAGGEIRNSGANASITALTSDSQYVYASGYDYDGVGGAFEGVVAARWSDGGINWLEDCHGDTYGVWASEKAVYSAGHAHYCGNVGGFPESNPRSYNHALAFGKTPVSTIKRDTLGYRSFDRYQHSALLNWWPTFDIGRFTGQNQATWAVTGNSEYVVMGGEFPTVSGVKQQGLVRFGVGTKSTNSAPPEIRGSKANPVIASFKPGEARINWTANWDRDNRKLTYRVYRNGDLTRPIHEVSAESTFWQRPSMSFVDTGLAPGSTQKYRVFAVDAYGNEARSDTVEVTIAADGALSDYASTVLDDNPSDFWRFGEASGTNVINWVGSDDLTAGAGVTRGAAGAVTGDTDKASTFNGTGTGTAGGKSLIEGPDTFTSEAWVRTTSTSGGKIIGFGSASTGTSPSYDRHTYMDNAGRITFGVFPSAVRTLTSTKSYNDGRWHHVVSTLGPAGMSLYVDGQLVGERSDTTGGEAYQGVWRIGGDNVGGWPNQPASNYLNGTIDEVAVYPRALSAAEVSEHFGVGSGTAVAPAPNKAPVAASTVTAQGLAVSANGAASSDADGTVASYSWNFGDNTPVQTGATTQHTYAAAGTYQVVLTVTDDRGATNAVTKSVTVTAPPAPAPAPAPPAGNVLAKDTFERTQASGLGSAEVGGAWSLVGAATSFSVTAGGGTMNLARAGAGLSATLGSVSADRTDTRVAVSLDKVADGGGVFASVSGRTVPGAGDYRAKVKFVANGAPILQISRVTGATEVALSSRTLTGVTYTAGETLMVRMEVSGTAPTQLRAKAWKAGSAEPADWQISVTDATAALQAAGGIGLQSYVSGTATTVPLRVRFDDLSVTRVP